MDESALRHAQSAKELLEQAKTFLGGQFYYARANVFLDKVALALLSKAVRVGQSIICLVESGFPEEAFGLSRTLVEIALNLRFIANKSSEARATRYVHYYAKWKMEFMRRMLKHYSYTKSELRKLIPEYKKMENGQKIS